MQDDNTVNDAPGEQGSGESAGQQAAKEVVATVTAEQHEAVKAELAAAKEAHESFKAEVLGKFEKLANLLHLHGIRPHEPEPVVEEEAAAKDQ